MGTQEKKMNSLPWRLVETPCQLRNKKLNTFIMKGEHIDFFLKQIFYVKVAMDQAMGHL